MDFLMKLFFLGFIFLNLLEYTNPQGILGSLFQGVQDGINLLTNNLKIAHRDFPVDSVPVNRDVSFLKSNEVSQSNQIDQNKSEEPYGSSSEQHLGGDSNGNSEEHNKEHPTQNRFPINNQELYNKEIDQPNRSNKHSVPFKEDFQNKTTIRKPVRLNQKPVPLEKERLDSNNFITNNKDNLNPNETANVNDGSTTAMPLMFLVNTTVIDSTVQDKLGISNISVINDSLKQNISTETTAKTTTQQTTTTTQETTTQPTTIEKDNNKHILKSITKRKFFFQAKPVVPLDMDISFNETIYYIDLD